MYQIYIINLNKIPNKRIFSILNLKPKFKINRGKAKKVFISIKKLPLKKKICIPQRNNKFDNFFNGIPFAISELHKTTYT